MARFRFGPARAIGARLGSMIKGGGERSRNGEILTDVFGEDPRFILEQGDLNTYHAFRHKEPNLVSIVDGKPDMTDNLNALVLRMEGNPLGAVSFLVQHNPHKTPPLDCYGRIDIVVVGESSRGTGIGRLLLLSVNLVLLRDHGSSLYSISCLAAHPAVEAVLESVGYTPGQRGNSDFVHEELRLEGGRREGLERDFSARLSQCFQQVRYALRQKDANG